MGVPKKSKIFWGKKEQGSVWSFCRGQKRRGADFATTRRMPSDASAALWQAELETLESVHF